MNIAMNDKNNGSFQLYVNYQILIRTHVHIDGCKLM